MGDKKAKKGILIAIVLIMVFASITLVNGVRFFTRRTVDETRAERIPVQVMEARFANLKWTLEQMGDIRPMIEVDVYPKVPGKIIERLLVEKGDFVKKGTVIAALEDDVIKAQLEEARATVDSAKASLKQVEANLEVIEKDRLRLENLYKKRAIATQRLDHIEAEHKAMLAARNLAEAQVKRAEAGLKQLGILHKDHQIYAPINGFVSARHADRGAMSSLLQPIIRISNEKKLKVVTTVTERDFPNIGKGMKAEMRVDAFPDKVFTGCISVVNPTIDPATRTGEIEINIPNRELVLSSGMFAHIVIHLGERRALVISRDALNKLPGTGNYYVYVVKDGKAVLKNVRTGLGDDNNVEIIKGLKAGEKVVVRGQNRLKDGSPVAIENQGTKLDVEGKVEG